MVLAFSDDISSRISEAFDRAVAAVHKRGSYDPSMLNNPEVSPLITETAAVFSQAIDTSIKKTDMPAAMRAKLEHSSFIFSGFKTHAELEEVSRLLSTDGVKTPFDTFARQVKTIDKDYNLNYLRAEYNFAVHSSRSAALWQRYSQDIDRYYLQYRTAGDERVREDHRPLHDITLPADDPFWAEYFPPNGWNCRCTAVRVRRSKYEPSDHGKAMEAGQRATTSLDKHGHNRAAIFRFNPGAQETLFPPRHPYYKLSAADKETVTTAVDKVVANKSLRQVAVENLKAFQAQPPVKKVINGEEVAVLFDSKTTSHIANDIANNKNFLWRDLTAKLQAVLKKATLVAHEPNTKPLQKPSAIHYYYYEYKEGSEVLYLAVEENLVKQENRHFFRLYSITDKLRKTAILY